MKNEGKNIQWSDCIFEILLTYDNKDKHSAVGMTPKEATTQKNEFKARSNIDMQSVSKRKYPELPVRGKVKIYRKKDKLDKERVSVWLPTLHTIKETRKNLSGQKHFVFEGKDKPYLRHELLDV